MSMDTGRKRRFVNRDGFIEIEVTPDGLLVEFIFVQKNALQCIGLLDVA